MYHNGLSNGSVASMLVLDSGTESTGASKLVQLNMRCASLLSTLLVIASNGCCLASAHGDHSFGCVFCKDVLTDLGTRADHYLLRPNLMLRKCYSF